MPSKRQQLAQVLVFRFRERRSSASFVAKNCRVSTEDVEKWLDGTLVPNTGEWDNLRRYVSGALSNYESLWKAARAEQDAEVKANRVEDKDSKVVTNIGAKLIEAVAASSVPASSNSVPARRTPTMIQLGQESRGIAKDGRLLMPNRPGGSMTAEARMERRKFAKGILLQRPSISINGPDGLLELMRGRFGVGIDPRIMSDLRAEIAKEHKHNGAVVPEVIVPTEIIVPTAKVESETTTATTTAAHSQKDLQAGIELILNAVPGLQQLTITVNEQGEVDVDFKIRKVEIRTIGGSIKIRAKQ